MAAVPTILVTDRGNFLVGFVEEEKWWWSCGILTCRSPGNRHFMWGFNRGGQVLEREKGRRIRRRRTDGS